MWYRIPFFKLLNETYNVKYIFTQYNISNERYGVFIDPNSNNLGQLDYEVISTKHGYSYPYAIKFIFEDYDILVDSLEFPNILLTYAISKFRNKHIILWSEEWDWKDKSLLKKLLIPIKKRIVTDASAILVPGTKHRGLFVKLGTAEENVHLMPNATNYPPKNIKQEVISAIQNELQLKNKKIILYVGRLKQRKGVNYLIQGFAHLWEERKDIILLIIGRGDEREYLECLTSELKCNDAVRFLGYVDDEDLPAYYSLCNVCVIPSIIHGIGDPWVFILNEAMSFGKPVIATDAVGAAYDLIDNGKNGYMVPERDDIAIYTALKEILSNDYMEKSMGRRSLEIIRENYQYDNMVDGFAKALNSITNTVKR